MLAAVEALDLGKYEEADGLLSAVIDEKGEPVEALIHRAFCRLRSSRLDLALEDASRAVELRPENGVFWMIRGEVFLEMGNPVAAFESLEKACTFEADNGRALYQRGRALLKLNRRLDAADSIERALQFERDYVLAQEMTH